MSWYGALPLQGNAAHVVLARNIDGRLEAFFTGEDNKIYHTWQIAPNSLIWSPQVMFPAASALQIAVGTNADGRLEIFYVGTNNRLYHNWQTAPADAEDPDTVNSWAGETTFVKQSAKYVAVGNNVDGRLEIFYVGTGGHLYHDWQTAPANSSDALPKLNSWQGETAFVGNSAEQIAVGSNVDGRLEIFYIGTNDHLFHNWQAKVPNANDPTTFNEWAGETPFGKAKGNQVCVGTNADGRLEIFYCGTGNHLYHNWQTAPANANNASSSLNSWQGETPFAGDSALQIWTITDSQGCINIFYIGTNHHLFHNVQKEPAIASANAPLNDWAGQAGFLSGDIHQVAPATDENGQLEVIYITSDFKLNVIIQRSADGSILGSNFNQFLTSNCTNLFNVSVVINITQDLVSTFATGSPGYGFQLNAWSTNQPSTNCVWQQYSIGLDGKKLVGSVDNWPPAGNNIINDFFTLATLPDAKIPAGFQLAISLGNDANGNISSANFSVFAQDGTTVASVSKDVLKLAHGKEKDIAPITGFQVVLVGYDNQECAFLSTGAGTIIYQADNVLTAVASLDASCTASPTQITQEIANSVYTPIAQTSRESNVLQQTFSVGLTSDQLAKSPRDP